MFEKLRKRKENFKKQLAELEQEIGEPLPPRTVLWKENLKAAALFLILAIVAVISWWLIKQNS